MLASAYQLGPATSLSPSDVWNLWVSNGGDPNAAPIAVAIVFSSENPSGNAGVVNDTPATSDYSIGLWQVNYYGGLLSTRSAAFGDPTTFAGDPNLQAKAAIALSKNGTDWRAWGPDLGYSSYNAAVRDPLPGSRVATWLEKNGYAAAPSAAKPLLLATSVLVLAGIIAEAISPGSSPFSPKRRLRIFAV